MKQWIFSKIIGYLTDREGYTFNSEDTNEGVNSIRAIVQDSFGFRYELQVKVLGRIQDSEPNLGSFMVSGNGLDV